MYFDHVHPHAFSSFLSDLPIHISSNSYFPPLHIFSLTVDHDSHYLFKILKCIHAIM